MRALRSRLLLLVLASTLVAAGCGPAVDLTKGLQLEVVSTGWQDVGPVTGKNKLVPAVTFRLKNVSDQKLVQLQLNAVFRRVNEKDEWGSALITAAGSDGLAAGATTAPFTVKSALGYTGEESREQMLQNTLFVDANVTLFGKHGSTQWVPLTPTPIQIARQVLVP
jgi:hypothetical protein